MYDVVIIGAGVVGGMVARTLSEYNLKILLLEKENDVAKGTTKANSAIVHAGFDAKEGSLKAKLNVEGSKMMKRVTDELGVKYKNNGSLVVGFNDEDNKTLEELLKRGIANGVEGLELIDRKELLKKEPNISDNAICALYAPTGAIVCPYELAISAIGNAMDNGAELKLNFMVEKIDKIKDGYEIFSNNESVKTKCVVNAAGVFSGKIAAMIGDNSFSITPRKGEYILLDKECGNIVSHTIFTVPSKMGKGILVSPTVDGNLLTGPTSVDIDDLENTETTAEGLFDVITKSKESVENIPFNKSITSFTGLRAVGSTGDFIINSPKKGFVNLAGIESPGLSAAPAIGVMVVDLLKEQGLELTKNKNYNPRRKSMTYFKDAAISEKNEIIKKDPSYGRIICRCETITEGEILEAIRTNPKPSDLDGVKRRTRAQMGRCQGGFCTPYIMKLLAKEFNIPYKEVTKSGGKSNLLTGVTKEELI